MPFFRDVEHISSHGNLGCTDGAVLLPRDRGEGFPHKLMQRDASSPRAKVVLLGLSACKAGAPGFVHNSAGPGAGSSCVVQLPLSGCFDSWF